MRRITPAVEHPCDIVIRLGEGAAGDVAVDGGASDRIRNRRQPNHTQNDPKMAKMLKIKTSPASAVRSRIIALRAAHASTAMEASPMRNTTALTAFTWWR